MAKQAADMQEGALIGERYQLSQSIGRGRGGVVWIATDVKVQRTVAAKPIALHGEQDAAFVLEQAKHASRLRHQNAVMVYDMLTEGPRVWIITEYVPSRTMSDFIAEHGRLESSDAATLGTQLAAALAAAHETGLLHRAVEPTNVLLADDGGVQLTDFGIGAVAADAAFQPPEVVEGGGPTTASDVFALGATLFYAVEGYPPFGDDGQSAPRLQHLNGTLLQPIVLRMLSADPRMRPTMEDAWRSLRSVAAGQPADVAAPPPVQHPPAPPTVQQPPPAHQTTPVQQPPVQQPPVQQPPVQQPPPVQQAATVAQAPAWPQAPQPRQGVSLRAALPEPRMIAAAVVIAVLTGILFAEIFLI